MATFRDLESGHPTSKVGHTASEYEVYHYKVSAVKEPYAIWLKLYRVEFWSIFNKQGVVITAMLVPVDQASMGTEA